jgi:hypothetical protein
MQTFTSKLYFETLYIPYNDGYLLMGGFYPVFTDKSFAEEFTDYMYKISGIQAGIKEINKDKLKLLSYTPFTPIVCTCGDRRGLGNNLQFFSKKEYMHILYDEEIDKSERLYIALSEGINESLVCS